MGCLYIFERNSLIMNIEKKNISGNIINSKNNSQNINMHFNFIN